MPIIRKVPAPIAAAWEEDPESKSRRKDDRYTWVERPALLYLSGRPRPLNEPPHLGDVVRLRAPEGTPVDQTTGVVFQTRVRKDGIWTYVQVAVGGDVQWFPKRTIAAHLGRLKGITRVDQPTKLVSGRVHGGTHGWFVRVYGGRNPRLARTFSDLSAGGQLASLKAALAFHAAHIDLDPSTGIPFL